MTAQVSPNREASSGVVAAVGLLEMLSAANATSGYLLPRDFYIAALSSVWDFRADYKRFKASLGGGGGGGSGSSSGGAQGEASDFCFCAHPFVLDAVAKAKIVRIACLIEMGSHFQVRVVARRYLMFVVTVVVVVVVVIVIVVVG